MKEIFEISQLSESELITLSEGKFMDWLKSIIKGTKDKLSPGSIKKGSIVVFDYGSKLYEEGKLNFYDSFPLVMVTSVDGNNFYGCNLHYIPIRLKKKLVKWLKSQYKKEFKDKNYKNPLPGFSYNKIKREFPFIAEAAIHQYIKKPRTKRITRISTGDLDGLSYIDTSKFIFSKDSKIKSAEQLQKLYRKSKSLQQRISKTTQHK